MSKTKSWARVRKERLRQLDRRIKWLESRVSVYSGKDPSYDEAELSALRWIVSEYLNGTVIKVRVK